MMKRAASTLFLLVLLSACGEPTPPEQRVRAFIDRAETLAETREFTELAGLISPDYIDSRGNDRLKAIGMLRGFFLRNKSVHLVVRIDEIDIPDPDYARVTLYVAMARRPMLETEAANLPVTNMHRVELELVASGNSYEVLRSEWQRAAATDILF